MSLEIYEKQGKLDVINTANNLDGPLTKKMVEPLPNYNGFAWGICGSAGQGKTTLLLSLMTQKSKKDQPKSSYRKLFQNVLIMSPTLGQGKSLKNDPFKDIPDDQKWTSFNNQSMQEVMDMIDEINERNEESDDEDNKKKKKQNIVLILDDVTADLRKHAHAEKQLNWLFMNRRHRNCSIFILVQKYKCIPTGVRANFSHFTFFRPKNQVEVEAICSELMPFHKKDWQQIMNYVFECDDKFAFMHIDSSFKKTNKILYYNKWNQMIIEDTEHNISSNI
jgi:GTPase SAR1 family protein